MQDSKFKKVENNKKGFKKVKTAKERNIYIGKVACPECESMDTSANNPGTYIISAGLLIFVGCLIAFSCCLWIPIIGWALLIPFGIGLFLGLAVLAIGTIITAFIKNLTFKCNSCGSIHKINSKEYKEMAKQAML
jgi:hypothetical protein